MVREVLPCYRCGQPASDVWEGVIYVRREIEGKWQSVPICMDCWAEKEPNRTPVRVLPSVTE